GGGGRTRMWTWRAYRRSRRAAGEGLSRPPWASIDDLAAVIASARAGPGDRPAGTSGAVRSSSEV
ncbi:hypothetical protein, partial [Nonomuraea angiospora]|uniref:hypothetical protein n=1 Tax=Nonomuraea angiospora TaxID=46172 RepID=UPI0029B96BE5